MLPYRQAVFVKQEINDKSLNEQVFIGLENGLGMKKKFLSGLILIIMAAALVGCSAGSVTDEAQADGTDDMRIDSLLPDSEGDNEGVPAGASFSTLLPPEFMAHFKGHELAIDNNPLLGTYTTTSECIMILLPTGMYVWQENQDVPVITGTFELFRGAVGVSGNNSDAFTLESDTGPLYTVIITFTDEHAAQYGTIQVFDFYKEGVYRVTDVINDFWFEATRVDE